MVKDCGNCKYAARSGFESNLYCIQREGAPLTAPGGLCQYWTANESAMRQVAFVVHSPLSGSGATPFRAQVVPDPASESKKRVKATLKRPIIHCVECDKWTIDDKKSYGLDLDGKKHLYGTCRVTGIMCRDNHFCGYACPWKE